MGRNVFDKFTDKSKQNFIKDFFHFFYTHIYFEFIRTSRIINFILALKVQRKINNPKRNFPIIQQNWFLKKITLLLFIKRSCEYILGVFFSPRKRCYHKYNNVIIYRMMLTMLQKKKPSLSSPSSAVISFLSLIIFDESLKPGQSN